MFNIFIPFEIIINTKNDKQLTSQRSKSILNIYKIFKFTPDNLGYGEVRTAWSPDANMIAVAGDNRIIRILDR